MKRSSIKVGTRGSPLALAQTQSVIAALQKAHPTLKFTVVPIRTSGDRIESAAKLRVAGKGLFVKELEQALLRRKIDLAVHSMKDMPTELPEGLAIGAVLEREEAADALVSRNDVSIDRLPPGSVVGTSSLRRQALLKAAYRHLKFDDLRGNLDTRLEKLRHPKSKLAAIVVAAAGLRRLLGAAAPPYHLLPKDVSVPAAGQGALCIEVRANDEEALRLLEPIHHSLTGAAAAAERALLKRLEGGCQVPLGAYAEATEDGIVRLTAALALPDGSNLIREQATGTVDDPESVAEALASLMKERGAQGVLASIQPGRRASAGRNGHGRARARKAKSRAKAKR